MKFLALLLLAMSINSFAVNLNSAKTKELVGLKGIGKKIAKRIMRYRYKHKFKKIEEIMKIKGIGNKKFQAIKYDLSV